MSVETSATPTGAMWTFATHGEDRLALRIMEWFGVPTTDGFYVDIGAFHPTVASNTAMFHLMGWNGINVEPNPAMAARLRDHRPSSTTIEAAIGIESGTAELLFFYEWASSNTLVPSMASAVEATQDAEVSARIPVSIVRLDDLLDTHLPAGTSVAFMSIDVEGMELDVLGSNDWERHRPRVMAVEDLTFDMRSPTSSRVYQYLTEREYRLVSHALLTSFYVDGRTISEHAFIAAYEQ